MVNVDVRLNGPLFDGRALAAVDDFVDDAEADIAAQARSEWMRLLDRHIQFPTPYYETQILAERTAAGWRAHDRGIIYGPWLEEGRGEGWRKRPRGMRGSLVRRVRSGNGSFRGYHAAARAAAALQPQVPQLVYATLARHLRAMGG